MKRTTRIVAVLCFSNIAACAEEAELDRTREDPLALRAVSAVADPAASAADSADASRSSIPPGERCGDGFCSQSGRCEYHRNQLPHCVPRLPSDITCENIVCPDGYGCVGGGDTGHACVPVTSGFDDKTCAEVTCGPNTECRDQNGSAMCWPLLPTGLVCEYVRCGGGYVCKEVFAHPMCVPPEPPATTP